MDPLLLAILLLLAAALLAAIDLFVPSGGVLITLSGLAAAASIFSGFASSFDAGLVISIIVFAAIPALAILAIRVWPHTPIGRRILLAPPSPQPAESANSLRSLIGHVVISRWPLLPTGQIAIAHQRFQARSTDGQPIDPGHRIKVVNAPEGFLVVTLTHDPLTSAVDSDLQGGATLPRHLPMIANY